MFPVPSLLAETRMAEISLQYREEAAGGGFSALWYLLIPIALVAVGTAIYRILDRPPAVVNTPQGMLHELCRAHRLSAAGRNLLVRIAEEAELPQPALLFLSESEFDAAVEKASGQMKLGQRASTTLGAVRRRLFETA